MDFDPNTGLPWGTNPFKETSLGGYEPLFQGEQLSNSILENPPNVQNWLNPSFLGEPTLAFSEGIASQAYPTPSSSPASNRSGRNGCYHIFPYVNSSCSPGIAFQAGQIPTKDGNTKDLFFCDPWATQPLSKNNLGNDSELPPIVQTPSSSRLGHVPDPTVIDFTASDLEKLLESISADENSIERTPKFKTPQPISNSNTPLTPPKKSNSTSFKAPFTLPPSPESPLKNHSKRQRKNTAVKSESPKKKAVEAKKEKDLKTEDVKKGEEDKMEENSRMKKKGTRKISHSGKPSAKKSTPQETSLIGSSSLMKEEPGKTGDIISPGQLKPGRKSLVTGSLAPLTGVFEPEVDAQTLSTSLSPLESLCVGQLSPSLSFQRDLSTPSSTLSPTSKASLVFGGNSMMNAGASAARERLNNCVSDPSFKPGPASNLSFYSPGVGGSQEYFPKSAGGTAIHPSLLPALPLTPQSKPQDDNNIKSNPWGGAGLNELNYANHHQSSGGSNKITNDFNFTNSFNLSQNIGRDSIAHPSNLINSNVISPALLSESPGFENIWLSSSSPPISPLKTHGDSSNVILNSHNNCSTLMENSNYNFHDTHSFLNSNGLESNMNLFFNDHLTESSVPSSSSSFNFNSSPPYLFPISTNNNNCVTPMQDYKSPIYFNEQLQQNFSKLNNNSLGLSLFPSPSSLVQPHNSNEPGNSQKLSSSPISKSNDTKLSSAAPATTTNQKRRKKSNLANSNIHYSTSDNTNNKKRKFSSILSTSSNINDSPSDSKTSKKSQSINELNSSSSIFVNFTSKDSKKLLSGVAPSGSSKRKKLST